MTRRRIIMLWEQSYFMIHELGNTINYWDFIFIMDRIIRNRS